MNMEWNKTADPATFCAWVTAYHGQQNGEVSEEFVLSDYYGDIRRVLCFQAKAHTDDWFFQGEKLNFEGVVQFSLLYITEDGRVQNATFSKDFSDSVSLSEGEGDTLLMLCTAVPGATYRVQSPRKILMKAKLQTEILQRRKDCISPVVLGEHTPTEEATLRYQAEGVETMAFYAQTVKDLSYETQTEIDASQSPVGELTYWNASLRIEEAHMENEGLACRGNLFLQGLYEVSNSGEKPEYRSFSHTLPFAVTVEEFTEGLTGSYRVTPDVRAIHATVSENSYGEKRIMDWEILYDLQVERGENETVQVVKDLYSLAYPCQTQTTEMQVPRLVGVYHGNLTVNEGKKRSELGETEAEKLVLLTATPLVEKSEYDPVRGKVVLEGNVQMSLLLSDAGGDSFADAAYRQPFRMEWNCPELFGEAEFRYDCRVLSASGRLDADHFYPNVELGVDVMVTAVHTETLLASVQLDTDAPLEKVESMVFCYPTPEETLWEIGKRYHTSCNALMEANRLTDPTRLERVLLIPDAKESKRA